MAFDAARDMPLLDAALVYRDAGLSVIATRRDKRPVMAWKEYQATVATDEQLGRMFMAEAAESLVLDYGDNALRHGPIDQIEVHDRQKKGSAEEAPAKMCPNCREMIAAQYRICPACDHEFPAVFSPRHNGVAGDAPVLSSEAETFERTVYAVRYSEHVKHKDGGPSVTLRVEYLVNQFTNQSVSEFLCFNHPPGNFARTRAETWWKDRSNAPVPATVMDAVALAAKGALAEPRALTLVHPAGEKYPRIAGMDLGERPFWDWPDEKDEDFFAADPAAELVAAEDIPF